MAPWIDESPWFGTPGAGRDSPPVWGWETVGNIYVYLITKIEGNPGITQVFWWEMVQLCGKTHEK